jgi:hypothetical protein
MRVGTKPPGLAVSLLMAWRFRCSATFVLTCASSKVNVSYKWPRMALLSCSLICVWRLCGASSSLVLVAHPAQGCCCALQAQPGLLGLQNTVIFCIVYTCVSVCAIGVFVLGVLPGLHTACSTRQMAVDTCNDRLSLLCCQQPTHAVLVSD